MQAFRAISPALRRYLLALLALLLWLSVASFYLLYLTHPLALVIELEPGDLSNIQITTSSSAPDAALYKQNKIRGRVQKNNSGTVIEFPLAFEYFDRWQLVGRKAGTLHLKSLALKGMFSQVRWTPDELARQLTPSPANTRFEIQDNALVARTGKSGEILSGTLDLNTLAAARSLPLWLGVAALAALLITLWLLLENPLRVLPTWRPSRTRMRPRLATILMWLLLGYGIFRLLVLVTATPLLGYANNGDFGRILSCFGLETLSPQLPAQLAYPDAPLALFQTNRAIDRNYCYLTSEIGFVWLALIFSDALFSIQTLGLVQALALGAAGIGVTLLYRRLATRAALVSAGIFALLMTDPMNGLYLNTFFPEFAALWCAYVCIALGLYMLLARTWDAGLLLLTCLALFGLGISKVQMWLLPFLLAAFFVAASLLWLRKQVRRSEFALGIGMLAVTLFVALGLQSYQRERPAYIQATRLANAMDLFFVTLLPKMQNPQDGLAALGLPPSCAQYIGVSYYHLGGGKNLECREIIDVSPARALVLLMRDPQLAWQMSLNSLAQSRPWLVDYIGWIGKGWSEPIELQFPKPFWSVAFYIHMLPQPVYLLLYLFLGIGALLATGILVWMRARALATRLGQIALLELAMSLLVLYALSSSFFGAGLNDFAKHTHLQQVAFCVGIAATLAMLILLTRAILERRRIKTPRTAADIQTA